MVMVFDQYGQQMPKLQGHISEVRERIAAAATDQTIFESGDWRRLGCPDHNTRYCCQCL